MQIMAVVEGGVMKEGGEDVNKEEEEKEVQQR